MKNTHITVEFPTQPYLNPGKLPHLTMFYLGHLGVYSEGDKAQTLDALRGKFPLSDTEKDEPQLVSNNVSEITFQIYNFTHTVDMKKQVRLPNLFGPNFDIPVLEINIDKHLLKTRKKIEENFNRIGLESSSNFGFNPHITVSQKVWMNPPEYVELLPLELVWGKERFLI